MRRWNGWGDDGTSYPLPSDAKPFLERLVGPATPPEDVSLSKVIDAVPASRLPAHALVRTEAEDRVRHARGQSFPDWVATRTGRFGALPDGVARPSTVEEVRELLRYADSANVELIPYGGGTSVVGHVNPRAEGRPVLTVDLCHMHRMVALDEESQLATFEAGVTGPDLEKQLNDRGYTLGHFPQSFELSTLGGWIASRSSGQQSLRYGRIDQLFLGGNLESPQGTLRMPPFPASAAGPDLRQLVLGSEGRLGILTEATVKVTPLPERESFHAVFFPSWESALAAVRRIVQSRLPLSMLRLSTPAETETNLALAGHKFLLGAFERYLAMRGAGEEKCMLILGFTGGESLVRLVREEALRMTGLESGVHAGRTFGAQWHKNRFKAPYLRNSLWEAGYAVDTLETATTWTDVSQIVHAIDSALGTGLESLDERVHVFTHLSHLYPQGSSVYTTYLFRLTPDAEENLRRWEMLKSAASRAIVDLGGTISHQHGVGTDHLPYLEAEKGPLGLAAMRALCGTFDPKGLMNPGKLIPTPR